MDKIKRTKEEIEKEIERVRDEIAFKELSDDFYYTKGTYNEDTRRLRNLEAELKEVSNEE